MDKRFYPHIETQFGKLALPIKDYLIIDYDRPASEYFDYERNPTALSKLAFLGKVAKLSDGSAITPEKLQNAGVGRKNLHKLTENFLLANVDSFKIKDEATELLRSKHFTFNGVDIEFDDSNADIYAASDWERQLNTVGELEANIEDIYLYAKVGGKRVDKSAISQTVSEGGIGWLLGAVLLKVSIAQGKLELSIPAPYSLSQNGAGTTSLKASPDSVPQ